MAKLLRRWAALFGGARQETAGVPAREIVPPALDSSLLDMLIAGLPDPVVALDRAGRVLAFNAQASLVAPALRRGELALIAFRMPDVVDAIRRASESGEPQRVEFFERVPL